MSKKNPFPALHCPMHTQTGRAVLTSKCTEHCCWDVYAHTECVYEREREGGREAGRVGAWPPVSCTTTKHNHTHPLPHQKKKAKQEKEGNPTHRSLHCEERQTGAATTPQHSTGEAGKG